MIIIFSKFINTEVEYTKKFTETYENDEIIRFYDNNLLGMYMHNFTLIKSNACKNRVREIILEELENRKNESADFLRIEFNFLLEDDFINNLPLAPQITKYDYMYIEPSMSDYLTINKGCVLKKASSEEILNEGIEVDILANESGMGAEFARRRIYRKAEVYKQSDSNLDLYVCYDNNKPIGNCEFLLNNEIAKLDDFDILKEYQRKGYGTSVIKYLLEEAKKYNIEFVYLITDGEDTAKEMYKKCGLKRIGEKTELFFDLK